MSIEQKIQQILAESQKKGISEAEEVAQPDVNPAAAEVELDTQMGDPLAQIEIEPNNARNNVDRQDLEVGEKDETAAQDADHDDIVALKVALHFSDEAIDAGRDVLRRNHDFKAMRFHGMGGHLPAHPRRVKRHFAFAPAADGVAVSPPDEFT